MPIRIIDYYDLIELPDGSHIPVPMAIKMVGLKKVLEIPVAKKKRTSYFYWCEECHQDALYYGEVYEGSFFKCRLHNSNYYDPIRQKVKEITFKRLVESPKLINLLKYIEVAESERWRSVGALIVEIDPEGDYVIVFANGRMVEIAEIEHIRENLHIVKSSEDIIETYKHRIHKSYEKIAESLSKFLPYKIYGFFGTLIFDDVDIKYEPDEEVFPVYVRIYPSYRLDPKEWHYLFNQIVRFLYDILPVDIANFVSVVLFDKPKKEIEVVNA